MQNIHSSLSPWQFSTENLGILDFSLSIFNY